MAFERIILSVKQGEVSKVKNILYNVFTNLPTIKVLTSSEKILEIEFKIPSEYQKKILHKFVNQNIEVIPYNTQTKKILFEIQAGEEESSSHFSSGILDKDKPKSVSSLDNILKSIERYLSGKQRTQELRDEISKTLTSHLNELRKEALIRKFSAENNIPMFVEIATNSKLKMIRLEPIMKRAGEIAIEVCAHYPEFVGELIHICNNRNVHNVISIRAAAKFAEIAFGDPIKYDTEIIIAVKRLNTKWLATAYDVAQFDLRAKQKENFDKMMEYVQSHKAK